MKLTPIITTASILLGWIATLPVRADDYGDTPPAPPAATSTGTSTAPGQTAPGTNPPTENPKPVKTTPVNPADIPSTIDAGTAAAPAIVAKLRSGELSPEEAWKTGQIKEEDILNILGADVGGAWGESGTLAGDLDPALAGLLVEHYPGRIQELSTLSPSVRMWLGEYYRLLRDPRAEEVFEGLIAEGKPHVNKAGVHVGEAYYFAHATRSLGEYYRDSGQYQKAADVFVQAIPNGSSPAYRGNGALEAARMYERLGDHKQAEEFYNQVDRYGDAWTEGVAHIDRADVLIAQGNFTEAQKLLQEPIPGGDSESIRVALLSKMGYSYYKAGEFDRASTYFVQALARYRSLPASTQDLGIEAQVQIAQTCATLSEQWRHQPMVSDPPEVNLVNSGRTESLKSTVTIQSFRDIPLSVVSTNPSVKVRVTGKKTQTSYFWEQPIDIEILPESSKTSLDAEIVISSSKLPKYSMRVPVHIHRAAILQLSPSSAFFGSSKPGEVTFSEVTLTGPAPFHILKVEPDNQFVGADLVDSSEVGPEHRLKLRYQFAGESGGYHTGTIKVTTDLPDASLIEIAYFAHTS